MHQICWTQSSQLISLRMKLFQMASGIFFERTQVWLCNICLFTHSAAPARCQAKHFMILGTRWERHTQFLYPLQIQALLQGVDIIAFQWQTIENKVFFHWIYYSKIFSSSPSAEPSSNLTYYLNTIQSCCHINQFLFSLQNLYDYSVVLVWWPFSEFKSDNNIDDTHNLVIRAALIWLGSKKNEGALLPGCLFT